MQQLGDPTFTSKSGGKSQLVLINRGTPVYTVHTDLIERISIESATTGTALLRVHLQGTGKLLRIPEMHHAQAWTEPEPGLRVCLGTFRIDYWNASFDEGASEITIEGRGPLGLLVDQPRQMEFAGELAQFLAGICGTSAPTEVAGIGPHLVNLYINMDSTYAALRLLAVSLGFVIKEDPKNFSIQIYGQQHEHQRLKSKAILEINDSNSRSGSYTKGVPLKQRR